jgi:4-amino-4-deoxy-L-arabinose transferase-like glycosyltransferase
VVGPTRDGRLRAALADVPRGELAIVAALVALGVALRLGFVLATTGHTLVGDEIEYDIQGRFITEGRFFWSTTPTGEPHATVWKVPGYPLFVGALYTVLGADPDRVFVVQALLCGSLTIVLTWVLARRLFGPLVAVAAAAVVAIYPSWQFETRLFAEALVTPLTLAVLIVVLERPASTRRALGVGALVGASILLRPGSLYLIPAVAVAWALTVGLRRGALLTGATVAIACLVILPWSIRNYDVTGEVIPLSAQDAALYGVFNDDAANDPVRPWGWRYRTTRDRDIYERAHELSEVEIYRMLRSRAFDYIRANPEAVPQAFFWNGLTRLWDVRRPRHILDEAATSGRSQRLTHVQLVMHYVLLPLALLGLWLARDRRAVVLPLVTLALAASVVYIGDATTRYRAPFDPVIVILAMSAVWHVATASLPGPTRERR